MREAKRQNPHLTMVSVMPKPNSPSTTAWARALRYKEIPEWPPRRKRFWEDPPNGYVLWPRHRRDLPAAENREQIAEHVRKCLHSQYWRGNSVTFVDDVHIEAVLMGLNPELEQMWTAGSEGGAACWSANQKPSGTLGTGSVSSFSYNAPTHLFLGRDTDARNVKRFGEIGGVDPKEIEAVVRGLKVYPLNSKSVSEFLYVDKRGPYLAVILPWLRYAQRGKRRNQAALRAAAERAGRQGAAGRRNRVPGDGPYADHPGGADVQDGNAYPAGSGYRGRVRAAGNERPEESRDTAPGARRGFPVPACRAPARNCITTKRVIIQPGGIWKTGDGPTRPGAVPTS